MLNLPEELQITSASVGNLTINIPLDLHRSPIEVFIDGVKVVATLLSPTEVEECRDKKRKGRRKGKAGDDKSRMAASILPTPEEVAREFVQKQPTKAKRKLERSVMAAYGEASGFWHSGFGDEMGNETESTPSITRDSDDEGDSITGEIYDLHQHSLSTSALPTNSRQRISAPIAGDAEVADDEGDSSDEETELGTGTTLEVPEFVASFIKGIGDRLQLHVGGVSASIQIRKSQAFPHLPSPAIIPPYTDEQVVTLEFCMAGVIIEGVTVVSAEVDISAFAPSGSGQIKAGKKKIQLNRLNAFLVGEEGWFDEPTTSDTEQRADNSSGGYDGTDSPYGHMQESVCTVKDAGASVATLKGEASTPRLPTPKPMIHIPPPQSAPSQISTASSSLSDDDGGDIFESPYDSMAEEEHDKLSASVVSLGSLSDTGTAYTSQQEHLTESQMFADPDDDPDDGLHRRPRSHEIQDESEELPFAMASYMADFEATGSLPHKVNQYEHNSMSSRGDNLDLPPLPSSPTELTSSQTSISSGSLPLRPMSVSHLPYSMGAGNRLAPYTLHKSMPTLISTSLPRAATSKNTQQSSIESLPPPPPEPVISSKPAPSSTISQELGPHSPAHSPSATLAVQENPLQRSISFHPTGRTQSISSSTTSESEWEDDEDARQKLSESMFFSHEDAGSLYMSAMSGALESTARFPHHSVSDFIRTDGARDVDNAMGASPRGGQRKGEVQGEELTEDELEQRLNRLVGSASNTRSAESSPAASPSKRMKKKIAEIDYVDVWVPALATPGTAPATVSLPPEPIVGSPARGTEATHHGHLPGSFSMYSASPPAARMAPSSPRPATPKVAVKFAEGAMEQQDKHPSVLTSKDAEVEIFIGKITMKADLIVGGLLAKVFAALGFVHTEDEKERIPEVKKEDEGSSKKKVEIVVGEVDCRLVQKLLGQLLLGNGELEPEVTQHEDGDAILDLNVQHTRLTLSTLVPRSTSSLAGHLITTMKLSLGNIELRDTKGAFINFAANSSTPLGAPLHGHPGKRRTSSAEKGIAIQSDVKVTITTAGMKTRVDVETLPLYVKCQLGRIEELLDCLGGFGKVLGLSSTGPSGSSTPTPVTYTQTKGVTWKEDATSISRQYSPTPPPATSQSEVKVDANIGGLIIDLVGEEGAVGLRTSIIKVRKRNDLATVIGIEQVVLVGPYLVDRPHDADARIIIDNTRMEFSGKPNDEDLARLLKLLTPSKDKFAPDDDIMLDILLEQRRQGSVLRASVGRIRVEVDNLRECEKFQTLGEEVAKVLAVTNYIPQDERPGLLTLLYVGGVDVGADLGEVVGKLDLSVKELELSHVGGPNLIALAMGNICVKRNDTEQLVGEGLPKEIAIRGFTNHAATGARKVTGSEDRPMVMIRIVGDDPEPIIKIKLWNLRVEYNVDTLMALMNSPEATADGIAREMVDSIATLTEKQVMRELGGKKKRHVNSPYDTTRVASPTTEPTNKPLRVEVVIRDSILGLNPLILPSRGLVILTESRFYFELPSPQAELEMNIDIKRASLSLIDNVNNLLTPETVLSEGRHKRRKEALSEHLATIAELGYVSIASISSARATLKLVESEVPGDKCVDLELHDDLFIMETCADSTQTLLGIVNGLKPPLPEGEEVKYCTEVMPINMFASMIEDAFVPGRRQSQAGEGPATGVGTAAAADILPSIQEAMQEDGDMVSDDVPMNLSFVESYYGNPNINYNYSQEELAEDILANDLTHIAKPSRPLKIGERGELMTFEERVQLLDDTPLEILDNHFSVVPKASLIEMAAKSAIGAPVRVKIRDVHFIWNLHDGYDWPRTRDTITKAVKRVEGRVLQRRGSNNDSRPSFDMDDDDQESVIGDLLFNSIYIGIPANRDPRELSKHINNSLEGVDMMSETGSYASTFESRPTSRSRASTDPRTRGLRLTRSRTHKMQIELKGVCVDFVLFPQNGGETQSSIDLKVRDMEIIDNVPTSTWKKFVTYMRDAGNRETGSQMAHIEVLNVKPVPTLAASELVIKVCNIIFRSMLLHTKLIFTGYNTPIETTC